MLDEQQLPQQVGGNGARRREERDPLARLARCRLRVESRHPLPLFASHGAPARRLEVLTCPQKCGQAGLEKQERSGRKKQLQQVGMRPMLHIRWSPECALPTHSSARNTAFYSRKAPSS